MLFRSSWNVILNPSRGVFKNVKNRKIVAAQIKEAMGRIDKNFEWFAVSPRFYPFSAIINLASKNKTTGSKIFAEPLATKNPIKIIDIPRSNQRVKLVYSVLEQVFREQKIPFEYVSIDHKNKTDRQAKQASQDELDIYTIGVDKGGAAVTSVVHMMFCSKLGANFPDPSGRICKLVEEYQGRDLSPEETQKFGERFEEIVDDDACVIPFIHRGQNWLYSDDLDLSLISPNMSFPDLQLIKIK